MHREASKKWAVLVMLLERSFFKFFFESAQRRRPNKALNKSSESTDVVVEAGDIFLRNCSSIDLPTPDFGGSDVAAHLLTSIPHFFTQFCPHSGSPARATTPQLEKVKEFEVGLRQFGRIYSCRRSLRRLFLTHLFMSENHSTRLHHSFPRDPRNEHQLLRHIRTWFSIQHKPHQSKPAC